MSSKAKHAARSQRSSHNTIPYGMFYQWAKKDKDAKYNRGINKAIGELLKAKEDDAKED